MRHHISQLLLLSGSLLTLVSCTSTEVLPPDSEKSSLVSLCVTAPGAYNFGSSSRADDSQQLRLIAHLYALDENGQPVDATAPVQTEETLYGGTTTTINFQIDNPGNYCATVFADYIPVGFTATEGHYPDQYYDTTVPGIITVNSTGSDFLNNENRDCFLGKVAFKKGLNALERDLVLTRPVSRVLISAPSDDVETLIKKVEITVCSHLGSYEFAIDNTETVGSPVTTATDPLATSGSVNVNPDGKKLFYFYTFAGDFGDDNRPALGEIQFTLSPKEGIKLKTTDRSIAAGVIKPAVNYQLSVTGNKGWIDAAPGADDITVTIQNLPDWSNNPQNINGL